MKTLAVALAQEQVLKQNLERRLREKEQRRRRAKQQAGQMERLVQLDEAALREMARQNAISPFWPHPMGWTSVPAKALSPLPQAADLQAVRSAPAVAVPALPSSVKVKPASGGSTTTAVEASTPKRDGPSFLTVAGVVFAGAVAVTKLLRR